MTSVLPRPNRVKETTATTGAGSLTLLGAVAAHRDFSVAGDGSLVEYELISGNGADIERGMGRYTLSGASFARTYVKESSNGNAAINLSGTSTIFITVSPESYDFLPVNIKLFGAKGDDSHDDTPAFQAAMDEFGAQGYGDLYLPPGTYICAGALQDTTNSNSQITLPSKAYAGSTCTINIWGARRPPRQFFNTITKPVAGYSIIKSTLTGLSPTASVIPAVIAGPSASTVDGLQNNVVLNLQNLIFELPSNPTLSCLNLRRQLANSIEDVLIHAGVVQLTSVVQPTNQYTYGILLPEYSHSPHTQIDRVTLFGLFTGLRLGELTRGNFNCWSCWEGFEVPFTTFGSLLDMVGQYWTPYGIVDTSDSDALAPGEGDHIGRLLIEFYNIENAAGNGAAWQDNVAHVYDTGNRIHGSMTFQNVNSGGTQLTTVTKNGGSNFTCTNAFP